MVFSIFLIPVHAQTTSEFGYQLHPEKLLENTEGTLQIFVTSNDMMVPKQINNLKVVSSDNSIIEILGLEDSNSKFITNVLIKAKEPGITNIVLAAPGFSSKEIALEVFNNNNFPTQILMKVTPEEFPIDGPRHGYVAIELATTGGLPTRALDDVIINLETPNKDVIKLEDTEVQINSGEYYTVSKFEIIGSGEDAIIFAETEGMKKISNIVKVLKAETPLKLELHVFPENFNSFSGTSGIALVQLTDKNGVEMIADEDINFEIEIENPNASINSSHDFDEVIFENKQLTIEKGSYSTFTKFTPRPNIGDFSEEFSQTYNMYISANNLLTVGDSFIISHDEDAGTLEGEGPSVTKAVDFLTTGKKEIIAIAYYETEIEVSRQTGGSSSGSTNRELVTVTVPVQASEDHEINISSSEVDTVDPINPIMKKGENVVIVYGDTGTISPDQPLTLYTTDNEGVKTTMGAAVGPIREDISLTTESLLPIVLAENKFPSIAYLIEGGDKENEEESVSTEEDEEEGESARLGVTPFIEDGVLTFSANEFVDVKSIEIKKNQPYALIDMISNKVGTTTLDYQMGGFDGSVEISSHTTDPSEIHLAFTENIIANSKTLATVQSLDSVGNPVYSKNDIQVKLVSSDEQILKTEEEVTISKGNYFTTFELETLNEGQIELSLLSEDFALSKYDVNIIDISPVLKLELLGGLGWNERIEAKMKVSIPGIQTALDGFVVEWETDGGEIRSIQEVTNNEGLAILNIIANEKETVTITAKVSGNGLSPATITKTAKITGMPVEETMEETSSGLELPIDVNLIILIVTPVAIAGALFTLKRLDKLDLITEKVPLGDKLNIGDKLEEIKERVSDIRNR